MAGSRAHTYLQTRVKILAGRLYADAELSRLLTLPDPELAKHLNLGSLLTDPLPGARKNRVVEQTLLRQLLEETGILLRPLKGPARKLLVHWVQKFELFNLKAVIRGKINGQATQEIQENLLDLPSSIALPHTELLRTESVSELLRRLEQGPYRDLALQARRTYEENQEPFLLDASIDQRFFTLLGEQARNCEPPERQSLQTLAGTLIDRQNLLLLLRYRFCYLLTPSETYYLLSPHGHLLDRQRLLQLVNLSSLEKVIRALPGALAHWLHESSHPLAVDLALGAFTRNQVQQHLETSPSITARSLAYLVLREETMHRLFALLQGRILGLPQKLIEQAMGLDPQPPAHAMEG